ncbi:hypothetical protein WJX72_005780 [[Myrmecia] bisecta]|uniref:Zinc finger PHD-type domain-containing protein n=1 Tax=[Myrmecia] bisecta TaxID=41462 RepID=A0AAW1PWU2_9CHLO
MSRAFIACKSFQGEDDELSYARVDARSQQVILRSLGQPALPASVEGPNVLLGPKHPEPEEAIEKRRKKKEKRQPTSPPMPPTSASHGFGLGTGRKPEQQGSPNFAPPRALHPVLESAKDVEGEEEDEGYVGEEDGGGLEEEEEEGQEEQEAIGKDKDDRANDTLCPQCDDGGDIIQCDGMCMRSFHMAVTGDNDTKGACNPMHVPADLYGKLVKDDDPFLCPNCLAKCHQCFVCGKEGLSSNQRGKQEVFKCAVADCTHFYHPACIGKTHAELAAQPLLCGLHHCQRCGKGGGEGEKLLVPCRRCPTAYHMSCLPPSVVEEAQFNKRGKLIAPKRLWIMPNDTGETALCYCPKHVINPETQTPDHVVPLFPPDLLLAWRLHYASLFTELASSKATLKEQARLAAKRAAAKPAPAAAKLAEKAAAAGKAAPAAPKAAARAGLPDADSDDDVPLSSRMHTFRKEAVKSSLGSAAKPPRAAPPAHAKPSAESSDEDVPLAKRLQRSKDVVMVSAEEPREEVTGNIDEDDVREEERLDPEKARQRVADLFAKTHARITPAMVKANAYEPVPYDQPIRKTIAMDRLLQLESSVAVAQDRPEVAHMVLSAPVLKELYFYEDVLRTVLAPFLHGLRYTSYGRHFTKTPLLQQVSHRLLDYMRAGDYIVDFSCGANEFVPLVKREALLAGFAVNGRSFDILAPKNMEDFVQMSWFDVKHENLIPGDTSGDRLVIGLNPPFGKDNALANKWVRHAAIFSPRIIVLIVPPGTISPDGYTMIYDDYTLMRDKAFYVPGSDQESWNKDTPAFRILVHNRWLHTAFNMSDLFTVQAVPPLVSTVWPMPMGIKKPGPCTDGCNFLALLPVMLREPYRTKHRETLQKQWRGIVAIGCYLAANVALNNLSLVHLSLSLNQVIRSAIPVLCALLAIPIEKKVPSRPEGMALVVLTAGVMISVWEGTVVGRPEGIALCIAATFSNAAMMTTSGKVLSEKVDVLRLTFYTAPVSAIVLLPAFLYKEYEPFQPYLAVHGRDVAAILAGTSALALAYNYIHNKMIQCMSATTTTVLGEVKIVALLLMSYLFLGEKRDFTLKMTALSPSANATWALRVV